MQTSKCRVSHCRRDRQSGVVGGRVPPVCPQHPPCGLSGACRHGFAVFSIQVSFVLKRVYRERSNTYAGAQTREHTHKQTMRDIPMQPKGYARNIAVIILLRTGFN